MKFCVSGKSCLYCHTAAMGAWKLEGLRKVVGRMDGIEAVLLPKPVATMWHFSYSEFPLIRIFFLYSLKLA